MENRNIAKNESKPALCALHVMPLIPGREKELAADAENLLAKGICTQIACCMTMVPEGNPPCDKAAVYAGRYRKFLAAFHGDPGVVGILIQASLGHGWTPDEQCDFQQAVRLDDFVQYRMCPLDKRFLTYLDDQIFQLAELRPAFFMVDDDFRLFTGHNGCFCPLHLAEFQRRYGQAHTLESLVRAVREDRKTAEQFYELQTDGLKDAARVIRAAIDRVDPKVPCFYCTCVGDVRYASELQRILAGGTPDRTVRINNARYMCPEMRSFPVRMYETAAAIAALEPGTRVLAETDTCPQNRWSTAATLLHAHYTGSILEGCAGAKHWITSMKDWVPEEGVRYREKLAKYARFYAELSRTLAGAKPGAPFAAAVLPSRPPFLNPVTQANVLGTQPNFATCLSRMGVPSMFVQMPVKMAALLNGEETDLLSDDELKKLARYGLILDGDAAAAFTRRGLASLTGVKAVPWTGESVSLETGGGAVLRHVTRYAGLELLDGRTKAVDFMYHIQSCTDEAKKKLAPSLTFFDDGQGARCAVFAASVRVGGFLEPFGLMAYPRKQQFIQALEFVCGKSFPHLAGDDEVYMKDFLLADGRRLAAFFNLSFDAMSGIPAVLPAAPRGAERLTADGTWQSVGYGENGFELALAPGVPEIIRYSL